MPKASSSQQPHHRQVSLPSDAESPSYSHDDSPNQPPASPRTAALQRKRKNADAQAAFRARRANYIANLEETVTSLENAVRRLQDALRDSRDEATELKNENQRLQNILEAAGIDHRRQSGDASLLHPNPSTGSLHNSPSPGGDFAMYNQGGMPSSAPHEQQPLDAYSPFYNPSGSLPSSEFLAQQQKGGGSGPHSRQVSLDSQLGQGHSPNFDSFGIPRPASAASGTSSHSSAHSLHNPFDAAADLEPSMNGGKPPPALQMGFDELNLYGNPMTAITGGVPGSGAWNTAFMDPQQRQQQMQQQQEQQESELGRSDTVKASDPRHLHRRAHSHVEATSPLPSVPSAQQQGQPIDQQQQQRDLFNQLVEDTSSSFEFDPYSAAAAAAAQQHSRPGSSASSLFSNEGDLGHHHSHSLDQRQQQQLQQQFQQGQHLPDLEDAAYYSSEGDFNEMDYMEGMESGAGGMALVDSLMVPSHPGGANFAGMSTSPLNTPGLSGSFGQPGGFGTSPGGSSIFPGAMAGGPPGGMGSSPGLGGIVGSEPQQVPMSSTLAVIKAQAFGTSRKARTRAKRPGADSAAKVAMEALQARAQGLGLDVDLAEDANAPGGSGARVSRSGATVKRRTKMDEAPKG